MATLKAIVDGTTYLLSGGTITYRIVMQNIGMPPIRNLTQRGPLQDGVTINGYRLDPRIIRLALFFQVSTAAGADDRRAEIYEIFRPRSALLTLEETLDNGDVRRIDGRVTGAMDLPLTPQQERIGTSQAFAVDIFCPDPTWYDPTVDSTTFDETDNLDWWLALGTITSGQVEDHDETPTQGQAITGTDIAAGDPWSVYFQTNISTLSPATEEYAFRVLHAGSTDVFGRLASGVNVIGVRISGAETDITGVFQTGTHDYMIVCNGTNITVYRDGVQVGSPTAYAYGIDLNNAVSTVWRAIANSGGAVTPWTPDFDYVALYNVALDSTQRTALISAAAGGYGASKTIANDGSYQALPIVYIVGPIEDPILTNTTTGEVLDFTSSSIAAGDTYIIDCRYGYKTVKNAAGTNKIADLTASSDLATFHLEPGDNAFTLVGTNTDANTQVTVIYNPRYIGL